MRGGAYANQRLSLVPDGKAHPREAKTCNRTWEIRPSGMIGGASENVATEELRTHLATERARLVTLRLQCARPSSIPTIEIPAGPKDSERNSDRKRLDFDSSENQHRPVQYFPHERAGSSRCVLRTWVRIRTLVLAAQEPGSRIRRAEFYRCWRCCEIRYNCRLNQGRNG